MNLARQLLSMFPENDGFSDSIETFNSYISGKIYNECVGANETVKKLLWVSEWTQPEEGWESLHFH